MDNRHKPALDGQGGFTIVELLVAVVILVFVSIALMQTALINIEFNVKNALRDEGVNLAQEMLSEMRNADIANLVTDYDGKTWNSDNCPPDISCSRRVRNIEMNYTVNTVAVDSGIQIPKQIELIVSVFWDWKQEPYSTALSTVRQ